MAGQVRRRPAELHDEVLAAMAVRGYPLYLGAGEGGWVCARPEEAALVLGPPRSGKTSAVVVPAVLAAAGPVVSTSTKLDVLTATLPARRRLGRCWLYDPTGSVPPPPGVEVLRWSPVDGCRRWDDALLVARAMVGAARPWSRTGAGGAELHWTERAEALLAPLMHAAALGEVVMAEVARWVNRREAAPALDLLRQHGADVAADVLSGIEATDPRELSGIWSTAAGVLAAYRSEAAQASAAETAIDVARFPEGADTIYVCAGARHQDLVAPLVVGLIEQVRAATFARAGREPGSPAGPPVVLALDEVANIAPLPGLPGMVAEGGGQGLLVMACFQDLSQARPRWGAAADGFLSLFGAKLVLPGIGDVRTLEAVSALCGEVDVPVRSTTRGPGWRRRSTTLATHRRRRVPVDEVARGRPGAALLLRGSEPPAWLRLTPWFADEPWRDLAEAP